MLTQDQIDAYVKDPTKCPHCQSNEIVRGNIDWDEPLGITVTCDDCEARWCEILKVYAIVECKT